MKRALLTSMLSIALFTGVSEAATSWSTPSGSGILIDYSAGQTENGLFTDTSPTVGGDTFLFFPNNFAADESSGFITDTLSFVATAKPGQKLTRISAGLNGDWSILGPGIVGATASLTLTNLNTSQVITQLLTFTPSMPTTAEDGLFTGMGEIILPDGWFNAKVELTANLTAGGTDPDTTGGYAGLIQLKGATVDVQAAPVPLPGALAAAPLAMGLAWYARRRYSH